MAQVRAIPKINFHNMHWSKASYDTTPKWHGFMMIKLAACQTSSGADLKKV
jgi:hypothetical protein